MQKKRKRVSRIAATTAKIPSFRFINKDNVNADDTIFWVRREFVEVHEKQWQV